MQIVRFPVAVGLERRAAMRNSVLTVAHVARALEGEIRPSLHMRKSCTHLCGDCMAVFCFFTLFHGRLLIVAFIGFAVLLLDVLAIQLAAPR